MYRHSLSFYRRYISYFLITMLVTILVLFTGLYMNKAQRIQELKIQSEAQIRYLGNLIEGHFLSVQSDILFLPELNELIRYKDIQNDSDKKSIELEFLNFSRSKAVYDQIRYIDAKGMEIIRVNYNTGSPYIVGESVLQDKSNRYYFSESISLEHGKIYISPLDLNKENGLIEQPLKPMIRFGTPIVNSRGDKTGVLILNYLAGEFLEELDSVTLSSPGNFSLLNEEGYWLSQDDPDREWGFMYPEKQDYSLKKENPELWTELRMDIFEQILIDDKLYTFMEIRPLGEMGIAVNSPRWYLMNTICFRELKFSRKDLFHKLLLYSFVAAIFFGILTYFLAGAVEQRNRLKEELTHSALYDSLTGLANRTLLRTRIIQHIEEYKRYRQKFAVMFIDLDGFKKVNDTMGHDAGDELLIMVAERLTGTVRSSDTVARVGGDEFVILMTHLEQRNDCSIIAEKVLKSLGKDFSIGDNVAEIGASIGVVFVKDEDDPQIDDLLSRADQAMYAVKKMGKGNFRIV
ncbi:MAG: diguanylate cyclase [Spirochaetales bacterium]|nr:diguanylate cyclase [Spirochaetales bacterium]